MKPHDIVGAISDLYGKLSSGLEKIEDGLYEESESRGRNFSRFVRERFVRALEFSSIMLSMLFYIPKLSTSYFVGLSEKEHKEYSE
jgi:hypothetical protein